MIIDNTMIPGLNVVKDIYHSKYAESRVLKSRINTQAADFIGWKIDRGRGQAMKLHCNKKFDNEERTLMCGQLCFFWEFTEFKVWYSPYNRKVTFEEYVGETRVNVNRFTLRGPLVYIPSPNHMLNFQLANILTLLICFKYYCLQCYVNIYECFHFFQTLAEENDIEALPYF